MKRSRHIGLVVLGTAALLAGCSDNRADIMQQQYASKDDCVRDWGDKQVCTESRTGGSGYVGPRYYWNHSAGNPVAIMPDGTERAMSNTNVARGVPSAAKATTTVARGASVSRGGFGGTAHGSSAGG